MTFFFLAPSEPYKQGVILRSEATKDLRFYFAQQA